MKNTTLFIALFIMVISACSKNDGKKDLPKCIEDRIGEFNKNSTCTDIKVDEYLFQSKTVYAFEPGTCGADMSTSIVDADCNSLGDLGGIAGNTKINGEDFSSAKFISTVWKK